MKSKTKLKCHQPWIPEEGEERNCRRAGLCLRQRELSCFVSGVPQHP